MKNQKGISLITLLITIIVMLIIASIATYNGINSINIARENTAKDKLKAICSAILKNDKAISFEGADEKELDEADFAALELPKYYSTDQTVKVKLDRNLTFSGNYFINSSDDYVFPDMKSDVSVSNELFLTLEDHKTGKTYEYEYSFYEAKEDMQYNVEFDEANGINRPILTDGMVALFADGTTCVGDVYEDNWYSYHKESIQFAKMNYGGRVYIWIPRFAYRIQEFYNGTNRTEVPNTAIDIVYLRNNTNYMANGETIDSSYTIHPAFRENGKEYAGMWVDIHTRRDPVQIKYFSINNLNSSLLDQEIQSHMMTASEMGAMLYILHSIGGSSDIVLDKDEYVAAYLEGSTMPNNDNFHTVFNKGETGRALPESTYGCALIETPWDRVTETYPTEAKPYLIRKFTSTPFDFTNSDGTDSAYIRRVIKLGDEMSITGTDTLAQKCTVYFNANGGTVSTSSKEVTYGETYGALPQPTRAGYTFVGWRGKNMLNPSNEYAERFDGVVNRSLIGYNASTGVYTSHTDDRHHIYGYNMMDQVFVGNTYTVSAKVVAYGTNRNIHLGFDSYNSALGERKVYYSNYSVPEGERVSYTLTLPAGMESCIVGVNNQGTNVDGAQYSEIQVEPGSSATEYEPYKRYTSTTKVQRMSNHTLYAEWKKN